jgi:hypothetical protein
VCRGAGSDEHCAPVQGRSGAPDGSTTGRMPRPGARRARVPMCTCLRDAPRPDLQRGGPGPRYGSGVTAPGSDCLNHPAGAATLAHIFARPLGEPNPRGRFRRAGRGPGGQRRGVPESHRQLDWPAPPAGLEPATSRLEVASGSSWLVASGTSSCSAVTSSPWLVVTRSAPASQTGSGAPVRHTRACGCVRGSAPASGAPGLGVSPRCTGRRGWTFLAVVPVPAPPSSMLSACRGRARSPGRAPGPRTPRRLPASGPGCRAAARRGHAPRPGWGWRGNRSGSRR